MKNLVIAILSILTFGFSANAQTHLKKDGTPDMRYRENKQIYGNSYSTPSYSSPSYSTPSYSSPSYSTPSYSSPNYSAPSTSYPEYHTNKDGSPDMRYKENKELYGTPRIR